MEKFERDPLLRSSRLASVPARIAAALLAFGAMTGGLPNIGCQPRTPSGKQESSDKDNAGRPGAPKLPAQYNFAELDAFFAYLIDAEHDGFIHPDEAKCLELYRKIRALHAIGDDVEDIRAELASCIRSL